MGALPDVRANMAAASASAKRFEPPKLALIGHGRIGRAGQDQFEVAAIRAEAEASVRADLAAAFAAAEAARSDAVRAAQALSAALEDVEAAERLTLDDLEKQAVALGLGFAEAVIGREIRCCDDVVLATARSALALVSDRGMTTLRVNPHDVAAVAAAVSSDRIDVVGDPGVGIGGAVAQQGPLTVDASIDAALARIRDALT